MKYRTLGRTGALVSEICIGTMTFGKNQWGVGSLGVSEATGFVSCALDQGVNFFDTADIYAFGESETVLGEALKGRRDRAVIATKSRIRMSNDPNDAGLSRRHIMLSCERSLKRLGTDRIDLYQIHGWDPVTPFEESLGALNDLVRQGKVLYIGVSNWAAWQVAKALGVQDRNGWARFVTLQPFYALTCRDIEVELVPLCLDQGLGILPWSPLAGGYLTGKYRKGGDGRLAGHIGEFLPVDMAQGERILDALDEIGRVHKVNAGQIALAWTRNQPGITSVIIGAKTLAQLQENIASAAITLSAEETQRLNEASAYRLPYPQWMIRHQVKECELPE
ncbi:MAG: aldo/keto reductase [Candidatus Hydrogenedentota bacterium]